MRMFLSMLAAFVCATPVVAGFSPAHELRQLNRQLAGQVLEVSLASRLLGQPRDLTVYLPPGYSPCRAYPLILWFHGGGTDERSFLDLAQLVYLDGLIAKGQFPAAIVACPDGTAPGGTWLNPRHSLYINGPQGRFADHVMQEVIPFLTARYSVRPERDAHALIGVSAGGFGAMNLGLKHRDYFGSVVSIAGGLNQLYFTCQGDYFAPFNPRTYRTRTEYVPNETLVTFVGGLIRLTAQRLWEPVFGSSPGILERIRRENPADLLCPTNLRPGELNLYVAYGARDHLNMAAHAESFVWLACRQGVVVACDRDPEGGHDKATLRKLQRASYHWLGQKMLPR